MKKILITGGAGFIGSHIVDHFVSAYPDTKIIVLDKMTYAADVRNIQGHIDSGRTELIIGDVCDSAACLTAARDAELVIHAAAESHVDNSFGNSMEFSRTNVQGTHCLMEVCRTLQTPKIIHISTDEVYGEVRKGAVDESAVLNPTNPYSASKAAAEMVINGYRQSFKLPVMIVRSNNVFGPRQYPEKIIPKFIMALMNGKKLTLHGTGKNRRHYLYAGDLAEAVDLIAGKGTIGEAYNIGAREEYRNLDVAEIICKAMKVKPKDYIAFVPDRPFNDARYAVKWKKIARLGWRPKVFLKDEVGNMVQWYRDNAGRYV